MSNISQKKAVAFSIGTGRSGTHFIKELLSQEPKVAAWHERFIDAEAFYKYCHWYDLPVDPSGLFSLLHNGIEDDLKNNDLSFEASAQLSLAVRDLYERFNAKFILSIRAPHEVVNSYVAKGWYAKKFIQVSPGKALAHQGVSPMFHNFSRIAPKGEAFLAWNEMEHVGKNAWFWNTLNLAIYTLFQEIPASHWMVMKLEEFDFDRYLELACFLEISPSLTIEKFQEIADQKPGRRGRPFDLSKWTPQAVAQFEREVSPAAKLFDYPYELGKVEDELFFRSGEKLFNASAKSVFNSTAVGVS